MAMTALEKALNKVTKDFKESFPNILEAARVKKIPMSSPKLNYVFGGGGFAAGRIAEFAGLEGGGKTTTATIVAAEIQKRPKQNKVIFIDFEYALDIDHAQNLGLDISDAREGGKLLFLRPVSGEDVFNILEELLPTEEFGLVIWDSVATSPTAAMVQNDVSKCVGPSTQVSFKVLE